MEQIHEITGQLTPETLAAKRKKYLLQIHGKNDPINIK
jgi:hypothetical protein